ncbi:MAG: GntR family transcriptional regulator [Gordonia sp. (in: high G+C Gram-positive bacteria)]|uniref:transcriptional regulator n=1 Tax=Gordonia sp. (in: high G+C Gram-positive bacteria) TaxID=84139 RepID=UPI0039E2ABD2
MLHTVAEVTDKLYAAIEAGKYKVGDALPSLDDLNREYFGDGAGPRPGRSAYAPLIAAGMVEARPGRNGGHFLIADSPESATSAMNPTARLIAEAKSAIESLEQFRWHIVEFQDITTGDFFGESLHPNRIAAERFAVSILTRLGEPKEFVEQTVSYAGWTCADTRGTGYGIRIYATTMGGDTHVDISGRR